MLSMNSILKTFAAATLMLAVAACALLAPIGADDEARRTAKVTLAAYETAQQAILIYGRLPDCAPEAASFRLCKQRGLWLKIKAAEKAATTAIAEATPVLNGAQVDAGQLVAALGAIEAVKDAVAEAQGAMAPPKPAPRGST